MNKNLVNITQFNNMWLLRWFLWTWWNLDS